MLEWLHPKWNPYNKVTGCVSVPKDLANRKTDWVLLYRLAFHRSREGLYFGGKYHHPPKRDNKNRNFFTFLDFKKGPVPSAFGPKKSGFNLIIVVNYPRKPVYNTMREITFSPRP